MVVSVRIYETVRSVTVWGEKSQRSSNSHPLADHGAAFRPESPKAGKSWLYTLSFRARRSLLFFSSRKNTHVSASGLRPRRGVATHPGRRFTHVPQLIVTNLGKADSS